MNSLSRSIEPEPTRNVMIVGVGGQGVIMVSKVMALLGQKRGLEVKQSEVHGMAKRGGTVFGHIRLGHQVWSPTIAKGEADALVALEWAEGLRWLDYLRPGTGVFIADTRRIIPPFACRNRKGGAVSGYAKETPADIVAKVGNGYALDATSMAEAAGDGRAANTVLLGALSVSLDFSVEDWLAAIDEAVPEKSRDVNRRAFAVGRAWAEAAHADPSLRVDERPAEVAVQAPQRPAFRLEINAAWCKGCGICVKLCPERCLALDAQEVTVLKRPDSCTGCHVCEWLCPDFAISIRTLERQPAIS